jgi:hypothetical protein
MGGGANPACQSRGINPLSLSPFISLNAITGLAGTADGTPIGFWPDESGNGHHAFQGVVSQRPTYFIGTSLNGSPLVSFDGLDAPNGDNIGGALAPNPSVANGYDLLFYGRFKPAINGFLCSVLFQDDSGGRPQCGYQDSATQKWFERDDLGTRFGDAFGPAAQYGLMRWKFAPTGPMNGNLTVTMNGTQHLAVLYQFNPTLSGGWGIGSNQVDNCACFMDLGAFAWYLRILTDAQVAGMLSFWQHQFG